MLCRINRAGAKIERDSGNIGGVEIPHAINLFRGNGRRILKRQLFGVTSVARFNHFFPGAPRREFAEGTAARAITFSCHFANGLGDRTNFAGSVETARRSHGLDVSVGRKQNRPAI